MQNRSTRTIDIPDADSVLQMSSAVSFPCFSNPSPCRKGSSTLDSVLVEFSVSGISYSTDGPTTAHTVSIDFSNAANIDFTATGMSDDSASSGSHSHGFSATAMKNFTQADALDDYGLVTMMVEAETRDGILLMEGHAYDVDLIQISPSVAYNYVCTGVPESSGIKSVGMVGRLTTIRPFTS